MIQPTITKKSIPKAILLNFLIMIIPFGIVYVIVMMIIEFKKTTMPIYKKQPIKVRDKRYKDGYRIDGWKKVKTKEKR